MDRDSLRDELAGRMSLGDLAHCERVEGLSRRLGGAHGLDAQRCGIAGLAHDIARSIPQDELLFQGRHFGLAVGEAEHVEPYLLHAGVGASILRHELGIDDEEVLSAVGSHTLGRPGMSELEAVVFIADHCEEGRKSPWAAEVRNLAFDDLWGAAALCMGHILSAVIEKRRPIHETSVATYNHLLIHREALHAPIID